MLSAAVGLASLLSVTKLLFGLFFLGGVVVMNVVQSNGFQGLLFSLLFLMWPIAGMLGLASWYLLTLNFWFGGTAKLRQAHWRWWFFLAAGVLAALPISILDWQRLIKSHVAGTSDVSLWLVVPLHFLSEDGLIVLSVFLVFLRLRKGGGSLPPPLPVPPERTLKELMEEKT